MWFKCFVCISFICAAAHGGEITYDAHVVRTNYGVAHVVGGDWGSVGYGLGYAAAEDNLCVLADAFLTYRGERSRYFGAAARIQGAGALGNPDNLDADFFMHARVSSDIIARFAAAQPNELRELSTAYAAGFSRYVREIRAGDHPGRHVACRASPWLAEATADDIYRRMYVLGLTASSVQLLTRIAAAAPGGPVAAATPGPDTGLGSNAIGFGAAATGVRQGLLFGNPHWYWDSAERFQQVHLKIPGRLDVEGGVILGTPVVSIGFNAHVAWTHTVSTAARFTLYRLKLVEGDPTAYYYDGQVRHMTSRRITVDVAGTDGALTQVSRTLYESHFGPLLAGMWTRSEAVALRDANAENFREYRTWLRWGRARDLDEFIRIQREDVSIPWVNTIAVGRNDARVWYADIGNVPNVDNEQLAACNTGAIAGVSRFVLDGSRSECEWRIDPASVQPGTFAANRLPQLLRDDYAANMNDSYWLANPREPLSGYARILGTENTEQSLRTRMGNLLVLRRLSGTDGRPGTHMSSAALRELVLDSRTLGAELFLNEVLTGICPLGSIELPSAKVDIRAACNILARWDGRAENGSVGEPLWDTFWDNVSRLSKEGLYKVPFDRDAPLYTPRGLNVADPRVITAFAESVRTLSQSPLALDASHSSYAYLSDAAGDRIPVEGGCGLLGYFTVACTKFSVAGAELVPHGNSYMQIVTFSSKGVEPYTLLVSSQSSDPASPHYRDYTRAYSEKRWVRAPFTDAEVRAAAIAAIHLRGR